MAFIAAVHADQAEGKVREIYEIVEASSGFITNYAKIFSQHPEVYVTWSALIKSIRSNMSRRRYELVTVAAARAMHSSYCLLAHSSVLLQHEVDAAQMAEIAEDFTDAGLPPADVAVMTFAEKVIRDAAAITADDVQRLRDHGLVDAEIFDVAAAAAARSFFSKLLDALGAEPDAIYQEVDEDLRHRLVVGRPISTELPEHVEPRSLGER